MCAGIFYFLLLPFEIFLVFTLYINDGYGVCQSKHSTYINAMNIDEAKSNWSRVKLETIFEDMVNHKPAGWSQTWDHWYTAVAYSRQWNAEGVYPSEYRGYVDKKVLFGFSCSETWRSIKSQAIKAWNGAVAIAKQAWHWVRCIGKARRHADELKNFAMRNPGHFVIAWNPEFRSFDKYVEWCGEALAITRVQQALGQQ